MTVLGDLGSDRGVAGRTPRAEDWSGRAPRLNVVALELAGPVVGSWAAGLPDDAFEHDGQLTKRDLRAAALARLAPQPGQLLWDVGAGAGSRRHRVDAGPPDAAGRSRSRPTPSGRRGSAATPPRSAYPPSRWSPAGRPTRWPTLPDAGRRLRRRRAPRPPGCSTTAWSALRPGGRLVVHGVTLETETLLARLYAEHGGELTRISVEHAAPIGSFTGWTPARAVTQWAYVKGTA